jgi:hypothetical protein
MPSSASFRERCRDRLHQTPIEAQPLPGQRCGAVAPRPRNVSVPSFRPIQRSGLAVQRHRVQLDDGLGGGAERSSSVARDPYVLRAPVPRLGQLPVFSLARLVAGPVEPVGGALLAPSKELWKGRSAFHSSGRIHRPWEGESAEDRDRWAYLGALRGKVERERVSNPSEGLPGFKAMDLRSALRRTDIPKRKVPCGLALAAPVSRRAHPLSSSSSYKAFQIEGLVAQQHVVDSSAELGRQDAQGLALAVLLLDTGEVLVAGCVPA